MLRTFYTLIFVCAFGGTAFAQALEGVPADFDYCPEYERTADNPDGNRDCGPGCIEEERFTFESGVAAVNELIYQFWNPDPNADPWEADIDKTTNMGVSLGTIFKLRLLLAHQNLLHNKGDPAANQEYEAYKARYCEFLKTANYID